MCHDGLACGGPWHVPPLYLLRSDPVRALLQPPLRETLEVSVADGTRYGQLPADPGYRAILLAGKENERSTVRIFNTECK